MEQLLILTLNLNTYPHLILNSNSNPNRLFNGTDLVELFILTLPLTLMLLQQP